MYKDFSASQPACPHEIWFRVECPLLTGHMPLEHALTDSAAVYSLNKHRQTPPSHARGCQNSALTAPVIKESCLVSGRERNRDSRPDPTRPNPTLSSPLSSLQPSRSCLSHPHSVPRLPNGTQRCPLAHRSWSAFPTLGFTPVPTGPAN